MPRLQENDIYLLLFHLFILDFPGTLYMIDMIDICIDPGQSGMLY
jgi:hypothetical protein